MNKTNIETDYSAWTQQQAHLLRTGQLNQIEGKRDYQIFLKTVPII